MGCHQKERRVPKGKVLWHDQTQRQKEGVSGYSPQNTGCLILCVKTPGGLQGTGHKANGPGKANTKASQKIG
jgi:hypothetical protein